jgi:hypothetical protein
VRKPTAPPKSEQAPKQEERPPQQEELLCTICGLRSCWQR